MTWSTTRRLTGYGEYRTHIEYMDLVADTYDFNSGALRKLNERVKDAARSEGHHRTGQERHLAGEPQRQALMIMQGSNADSSPALSRRARSPCDACVGFQ